MSDKSMTEFMDVNVNGTKICTIEYYFDTENSEIYMRIPELSDGYIKMNMEQMTQEAVEEADQELDSSFTTSLDLADSMNSYFFHSGEPSGSRLSDIYSYKIHRYYF